MSVIKLQIYLIIIQISTNDLEISAIINYRYDIYITYADISKELHISAKELQIPAFCN